jgi:hypothetical protein
MTWRDALYELKKATETEMRPYFVAWCTETITDARFLVRNVGVIETEGRHFRAGVKGQADVYGWLFRDPYPMEFEIELKNVRTVQNKYQKAWAAYCAKFKIPYILLRALEGESPYRVVERWARETSEWMKELRK